MSTNRPASTFPAHIAQFSSENLVLGAGVAIFHIASARVVICRAEERGRQYYFLPKGRRDAGEESGRGAEREGYEESGYRNRLLPLPIKHRQPQAHPRVENPPMFAEPVWMQFMPMRQGTIQYVLYWYIAETLPPDLEKELETKAGEAYKPPPSFPTDLTLRDRMKQEPEGYEPVHHEGTGVDEEEQEYESFLVPIEEAVLKLGTKGVMADVILKGWKGIQDRLAVEASLYSEDSAQPH
ncbi:hypothetical protein K491DRAFT_612328 [Lophiostoma macrostomum CBS 122681]|uniref:Nudix hydrolase domain-containing protein n=1 Tax=Lophiostoma macrostomum CBS 122681 TaxID=1314788 RepID=A0A6A6SR65_9PLEO|nr:hypothetical protein K491DRAFT_612328 [Lophiostoma macrostomum CBS 122681]